MRLAGIALILISTAIPLHAQEEAAGPSNAKAQKTYNQAMEYVHQHNTLAALESFKKADKQDEGHCRPCQRRIIKYGMELGDWKAVDTAAEEMVDEAEEQKSLARAHYEYGVVLMDEGFSRHKDELFERAHEEMTKALAAAPNFPKAVYNDGVALAHMNQDAPAKAQFEKYVQMTPTDDIDRRRAELYIRQPEMARARMAPPFVVTTLDGQRISLDDLRGKVVLIDFWATWCGPCREALPHLQAIANKFEEQPLVILSVSLDTQENRWKEFVAKNSMTWLNCRDGADGPLARQFGVHEIPHTFTIDADGILQDEHVGDAAIEGKLKKQIARALEVQAAAKSAPQAN